MKIEHLAEPELEFGTGKHIDIRFGLMNYKPFDYKDIRAPKAIKLGLIGTNETIEGVSTWVEKCSQGIPAKESNKYTLFPEFPGFGENTNLPAPLTSTAHRPIKLSEFEKILKLEKQEDIVTQTAALFLEEIEYLTQSSAVDIAVCAIPDILVDYLENRDAESNKSTHKDFRDYLKARAMRFLMHTQLILPSTYDTSKRRQ
ncbi:MAG: hypothetical protein KF716_27975 [Anaerolineae bacterium]|nr:hypothetical protein [Anaerolineae bacterium]